MSNVTPMKLKSHLSISILCLLCAVACMIIGLFGYRQNLMTAYSKEAIILEQDAAGQNTEAAIKELETYSERHMHADVSFWLEASYNRDVALAQAKSAIEPTATTEIYTAAQTSCSGHTDSITKANCVIAYVHSHTPAASAAAPAPAELPSKTSYSYAFSSPAWSWDLSGVSFLLGGVALLAAIFLAVRHK